ncbi:MAG TPA: hypothetical protein VGR71_16870 [Nitrospira sp.]|nr:hypothetical protein [Nitrospira sp.]
MSNTRHLTQLNRTSGLRQRFKQYWSGQLGNPTTQRRLAEQRKAEDEKNRRGVFILTHRGGD